MAAIEDRQRPDLLTDLRPGRVVEGMLAPPASARAHDILGSLVRERQELRRSAADRVVLEANRLAIVYWQQRLSHALAAEHPLVARPIEH